MFWIKEGVLFTPALECGVLNGVMRREVMDRAALFGLTVREGHFPPAALAEAEAAFITNSLIGVRRVHWLDGSDIPGLAVVTEMSETIARALGDVV